MTPRQKWTVAGGVAAVAVPALLNYLAARAESNEAKVRAEVAYTQMVSSVKELQDSVRDLSLSHARLEGAVESLQQTRSGWRPTAPSAPSTAGAMKPPPSFEDAVQSFKAKR